MHNLTRTLPQVKRYTSFALKAVLFLGGLYILGELIPALFSTGPWGVRDLRAPLLLLVDGVVIALVFFLLKSRFFTHVRQQLKLVWLPAVLLWLLPFIGLLTAAFFKGQAKYGIALPEWPDCFDVVPWNTLFFPQMAGLLCAIVIANIAARTIKCLSANTIRLALLFVFFLLSVYSSYIGSEYCKSGATWDDWEFLQEAYLPNVHIAAFWIAVALIAAWCIITEMFSLAYGKVIRGILKTAAITSGAIGFLICGVVALYAYYSWGLPSTETLKTTEGVRSLLASSLDEAQLKQVALIPPDAIPPYVERAVIAASWTPQAYRIALFNPSGVRLSCELARLLHPKEARPYSRIAEVSVLTQNIEYSLNRKEMISAWLATSYFGKGIYGATAASEVYFEKPLADLNVCEAALLAALPYSPTSANPINRPATAKERLQEVLSDMVKLGLINEADREICN